jgi:hypothetical protein
MMLECPRCGFEQPKDQFCAKCGLDIDSYVAKPKPAMVRLLQNPNLHLSLIGILIVIVIGYIVYSQRALVARQMGSLLDLPVSSRDAADPNDPGQSPAPRAAPAPQPAATEPAVAAAATEVAVVEKTAEAEPTKAGDANAIKLTANNKIEVNHWEMPREALANLLTLAEKLGESNAGRAYFYPTGEKIVEQITSVGQRLALSRNVATRPNSQITMETPATSAEAFQFGMQIQITKVQEKELGLKWDVQLVLPQMETPAEAASAAPTVRSSVESTLNGTGAMTSNGLLVIVMEPVNRTPRQEFLVRAGEGPWSVFSSPEFRGGLTDWVITVQIK